MRPIKEYSSFRDPSGFVFYQGGNTYRQINKTYKTNYDLLIKSGLYCDLVKRKLLIPHTEVNKKSVSNEAYKIIKPQEIPFISYPYEWCFNQLKDAALLTLNVQSTALKFGMSLKDATSFNIQFYEGKPIFIDSLSFEKYEAGKPWIAYRQFCEQFLTPLALMSYKDVLLEKLLIAGAGSIPLDLAAKLLPFSARLNPSLLLHVFAQTKGRIKSPDSFQKEGAHKKIGLSLNALSALIESLTGTVKGLTLRNNKTVWSSYYSKKENVNNYSGDAMRSKERIVKKFLAMVKSKVVWDIGANNGEFSKIPAKLGMLTISFDNDHTVIENNYEKVKKSGEKNILPLWEDIINPTPAIGWNNTERKSFLERGGADVILALALVHHLAIANNLPLIEISNFLSANCKWLIIEFVPKEDSQVTFMLSSREDIFPEYNQANFEKVFSKNFLIKKMANVDDSKRLIYLMRSNHK